MDTAFFFASKIVWALISPDSLIVILGVGAWIALRFGWVRLSRHLLSACAFLLLVISCLPVGEWLLAPLENRFAANAALPTQVEGIVVLGGFLDPGMSNAWNQAELGSAADRLTAFQYLARLYPDAQLVFTGGSGRVTQQEFKEADSAQFLMEQLGMTSRPIVFESESRNTSENAIHSKQLVTPTTGANWILVTSAFHMPRAVSVFCKQDWPVYPYPVDHYSLQGNLLRLNFEFSVNLSILRNAMREWVGLFAYRVTGRSAQLLPGDGNHCGYADGYTDDYTVGDTQTSS